MAKREAKRETLCWGCEKAQKKCSWSKNFEPVKGWDAKPTKVYIREETLPSGKVKRYYEDSFCVRKCPEFEPLKGMKKDPTIDDVKWLRSFNKQERIRKHTETDLQKQRREFKELILKMVLEEKKHVPSLAKELGCTRGWIYKIIRKERENDRK